MSRVSREEAQKNGFSIESGGFLGDYFEFDMHDGFVVGIERCEKDNDLNRLFKGLPNDRAPCNVLGYVIKGKVEFEMNGERETYVAGDIFHAPPDHTVFLFKDSEWVIFIPKKEMEPMVSVIAKNIQLELEQGS